MRALQRGAEQRTKALRDSAALLGDSQEAALLRGSVRPPAILDFVERRTDVIGVVREDAPDVVVFATQDHERLPTAPLIAACAHEHPSTVFVVLCATPPPRGSALLAAS